MQKIDKLHDLKDSLAWAMIEDDYDEVRALCTQIETIAAEIAQIDELPPLRSRCSGDFHEIVSEVGDDECQIQDT